MANQASDVDNGSDDLCDHQYTPEENMVWAVHNLNKQVFACAVEEGADPNSSTVEVDVNVGAWGEPKYECVTLLQALMVRIGDTSLYLQNIVDNAKWAKYRNKGHGKNPDAGSVDGEDNDKIKELRDQLAAELDFAEFLVDSGADYNKEFKIVVTLYDYEDTGALWSPLLQYVPCDPRVYYFDKYCTPFTLACKHNFTTLALKMARRGIEVLQGDDLSKFINDGIRNIARSLVADDDIDEKEIAELENFFAEVGAEKKIPFEKLDDILRYEDAKDPTRKKYKFAVALQKSAQQTAQQAAQQAATQ
jgi:hypothetical protein